MEVAMTPEEIDVSVVTPSFNMLSYLERCVASVADQEGVAFLDAGQVIRCSDLDGIHYEADQHELLGRAAAKAVHGALAAPAD